MSIVRFISDLHFGHEWAYLSRGFSDIYSHDEHIIAEWNKVVHKKDTTFILGDLTMENKNHLYRLDALLGRKILIGGNHDKRKDFQEISNYVESIVGCMKYKNFMLTHIPIHPSQLTKLYGNIHGHIHSDQINDNRYINVCCEIVNFVPQTLEQLIERNQIILSNEL